MMQDVITTVVAQSECLECYFSLSLSSRKWNNKQTVDSTDSLEFNESFRDGKVRLSVDSYNNLFVLSSSEEVNVILICLNSMM